MDGRKIAECIEFVYPLSGLYLNRICRNSYVSFSKSNCYDISRDVISALTREDEKKYDARVAKIFEG